jgi:hypothetical protein
MRSRNLSIVTLALLLLDAASGVAATLRTPFVRADSGQSLRVAVTNVGKKTIEDLVVTLTAPNGTVLTPAANICAEDGPLLPGRTCQVIYSSDDSGFATVTSKGKFLAAIQLIAPSSQTQTVIPATK